MVDDNKTTDASTATTEIPNRPELPAAASGVAAVRPDRARVGSEHKRLSKGQRKHLRRQKQAGEIRATRRR